MHTNKNLLLKGIRRLGITGGFMFLAPIVLYQAFRNQLHPWYGFVLVIGLILAVAAVVMGFWGIKTIVDSIFQKEDSKK